MEESKYNIEKAIKKLVLECFDENKEKTYNDIAMLLGISERTLFRYAKELNIPRYNSRVLKSIQYLRKQKFTEEEILTILKK